MDKIESTEAAWDRAAEKYEADVEQDIAFLRGGGISLQDREIRALGDLKGCRRAIHLLCSHGLDALSLLNLGVAEVVGVDLSSQMLTLARRKSDALGAAATWIQSEVLAVPKTLDGTADLVFTGNGALPWVSDLNEWAATVARLLRPGGKLCIVEGHPLNWVWNPDSSSHRLSQDGRSYFDGDARPNEDFPAAAVKRFTPDGEDVPLAWEFQWNLGEIVTAIADAGLRVERLEEYPDHFWPQFQAIPDDELARLPHAFSLIARLPGG